MKNKIKMLSLLLAMKWELFWAKVRIAHNPFLKLDIDPRLVAYCLKIVKDPKYTFTDYAEKMCSDKFDDLCDILKTDNRQAAAIFYHMLYLAN